MIASFRLITKDTMLSLVPILHYRQLADICRIILGYLLSSRYVVSLALPL